MPTVNPSVVYATEPGLKVAEFIEVLEASGLGATRPIGDANRIARMLSGADLVVTARVAGARGALLGVARCITDFVWCCYLSDLAVVSCAQGLGVGAGLMQAVRGELGPKVSLILGSLPDAVGFYERIGMARMPDVFWHRRES